MQLDLCIKEIESKIHKNDTGMLFVNVDNTQDYKALIDYFKVGNKCVNIAQGIGDNMPSNYDIINNIRNLQGPVIIEGVSACFRLMGSESLLNAVQNLIDIQNSSNNIIILYQCKQLLLDIIAKDFRTERFILLVDGKEDNFVNIMFLNNKVGSITNKKYFKGMEQLLTNIERFSSQEVYVTTRFTKKDFPYSAYLLDDIDSNFKYIRLRFLPELEMSDESILTKSQWDTVLKGCIKWGDFNKYFTNVVGKVKDIAIYFKMWKTLNLEKKTLVFLVLRIMPNLYDSIVLKHSIKKCKSIDGLALAIYKSIDICDIRKPSYWDFYNQRKELLSYVGVDEHVANEFCAYIENYNSEENLYYLTDLTTNEKKLIIKTISIYHENISNDELFNILSHIYVDLKAYLDPYDFKNSKLNEYFNEYKELKVKNYISEDFLSKVKTEAIERNYNKILPTRAEKVRTLNKNNCSVYFVDAMGVEYLSFILNKATQLKMMAKVTICRSELPSITSLNKEFLDEFKNANCKNIYDDIKTLDKIKHSGKNEYDYSKSPYPTYLIDELDEIELVLKKINAQLGGAIDRSYIISDHGASRLAVIAKKDAKWVMNNKGEHGGRCCKKDEGIVDNPNEYMTDENGYWVLANYDIIKGSRAATVEVHGGATLEEVCVPIIELTRMDEDLTIDVVSKVITIQRGHPTILKFVCNKKLSNVSVIIGNKVFGVNSEDNKHFSVDISSIRIPKEYKFDISSNDMLLFKGLSFELNQKGLIINDLL